MAVNRGKSFEGVVEDCLMRVDETSVVRLYDPQGGYSSVANICDYIAYRYPTQYVLECKAVHKNLLSIHSNNPKKKYGLISNKQWEGMLEVKNCSRSSVVGVICWWIDHDVTRFIPIRVLDEYYKNGMKSVRFDIEDDRIVDISGIKKRVFFDYDMEKFLFDAKMKNL